MLFQEHSALLHMLELRLLEVGALPMCTPNPDPGASQGVKMQGEATTTLATKQSQPAL